MKSLSQFKKRQQVTIDESHLNGSAIPTLPSTFSVHDFHSFGIYGNAMAPGLHFHLTASINAETDIPLVPSMSTNINGADSSTKPSFVMHWLNNKEMFFTQSAEKILQDISLKIIQNESTLAYSDVGSDTGEADGGDTDETDGASVITAESKSKIKKHIPPTVKKSGKHINKALSHDEVEHEDSHPAGSRQSFHTTSSSTSLATEMNATNITHQSQLGDLLDRKLEALIREWHSNSDLLFSIHPLDGSLLVWLIEWLDESSPSSFRQPQINFSSRIPNAIPLGDAATMSHNIALYSPNFYLDLKSVHLPNSSSLTLDIQSKDTNKATPINTDTTAPTVQTPVVCMLTKHINGSMNLWNVGFGEGSHFTQVLSISHSSRVCGHRFRVNDVTCHPVLPLLLTTSHHNLPGILPINDETSNSSLSASPVASPSSEKIVGLQNTGFCSELILWRVDPVGPLSKSGGVTELARINSLQLSAFANVAWIPTLLPSTTIGSISNSPSACFVASDGKQLRIYQAVIDARTLLAEVSSAERKSRKGDVSPSVSDDSTSSEAGQYRHVVRDAFKIVSLQSTARPGCVLELNAISDAVHDWKNTQLLHEQLIRGDSSDAYQCWSERQKSQKGLADNSLGAVVDLRHSSVFEEPFYLVVIEKNESQQSVLHMWRLLIASQPQTESNKYSYVPDSNIIQENSDHSNASSRSNSVDLNEKPENIGEKCNENQSHSHSSVVSPLRITTEKVCTQVLPLPPDVEVIHATPAAGHLSSSNIYPACFAPYLIVTACSDGKIRFWRCSEQNDGTSDVNDKSVYNWMEWEMLTKIEESSAFEVPGLPLYVSCSYSGRVACAYKQGQSFSRPSAKNPNKRFINVTLAIIECESSGGSEWVLEDTIQIKNIPLPQTDLNLSIDLAPLVDTTLRNKWTSNTLVNHLTSGGDEHTTEHRGTNNIQRLLSVPSYTTLQSLKRIISEKGNQFTLTQKSLVQLDWVSTEDGSHVLTVSAGSKITLFTPVSTDIAQANLQTLKASEKSINTSSNRMLLKQASSMAPISRADEIRWMTLRSTDLATADGLPPLPMQLAWVRDGILVVGMDNEMLIYTQWKGNTNANAIESSVEITESRILTEKELLTHAQESSQLRLPSHPSTVPRSPSVNKLTAGLNNEHKKASGTQSTQPTDGQQSEQQIPNFSHLPDFGIFEASRLACPVLPQYHPKQLMELLAFGKVHRVRAILGHLVSCLASVNSQQNALPYQPSLAKSMGSESEKSPRSWLRSRTLSVAAPTSPHQLNSPHDSENFPIIAEEVQLDYTEITSIRPLPLYALIEADDKNEFQSNNKPDDNDLDYDNLFDSNFKSQVEDTLDEILGRSAFNFNTKPKKPIRKDKDTTNFGLRQARILTKLLTHSHLPGLSSLDQMHLLALADSVASFNPNANKSAVLDMNGREEGTEAIPVDNSIVSADSLDNCGLRYLLTMRQHVYLLRCLPLVQRRILQKEGLGTHSIVWAFHSETQEELVQLVPSISKDNANWSELREIGVGYWIRNNALLRKLIERLAKAAYLKNNNPLDAALFYLAMKKQQIVYLLFRSVGDTKMTDFFQHKFSEEKWRKAALKNAFALMGKQRFEHAVAFFLLAGAVWDAVEVCLSKLDDLQLAIVVIRLYEGDIETIPENLKRLLFQEVLGRKKDGSDYKPSHAHPDPFLRSMGYWILQDYNTALTTLLERDVGTSHPKYINNDVDCEGVGVSPSVFNFYLYLRTQPLIVKRQFAQNMKDKKQHYANISRGFISESSYGSDAITPFERRLFFMTAHSHFRAGCPSLALEVLSRLPNRIETNDRLESSSFSFDGNDKLLEESAPIATGSLQNGDINDNAFDWGAPSTLAPVDTSDFQFSVEPCSDDEESTGGLEMKTDATNETQKKDESDSKVKLDVMAQQLKFIACLKILMEELSTLATGFEVDGGQLRYQLYVWLEKSVQALKSICNYRTFSMRHTAEERPNPSSMVLGNSSEISPSDRWTPRGSHSEASGVTEPKPSLHEILLADKMDFEAKLDRSSRRKLWLTSNEALMRTLLSYCSLHGAHGGGLSSVRMELILLLQELQQERSQQQLLSPLPFPTTLPLLAASVACQKTVVADPIRHLQSVTHDILNTVLDMTSPPLTVTPNYSLIYVLRDLGISLSSCIYQSLCDSDAITSKPGVNTRDDLNSSVVCQNTHLLAGHQTVRRNISTISTTSETNETLTPTTAPNKWPGVQSLRALLARDKDEDSPKLHSLLCESFVAVFLSQFIYSSAACDSYMLYRLIGMDFKESTWAQLFGGGAKKLIHVATGQAAQPQPQPQQQNSEESESSSIDFINTLSKQRMKLHMKILQQLSQTDKPIPPPNMKEDRPTYREQFIPPQTSMISLLMTKPILPDEFILLDYDSSESVQTEDEENETTDFDDLGATDSVFADTMGAHPSGTGVDEKKLEQEVYAWGLIRFSVLKLAKQQLLHFLSVAGIEISDLPITSPLIHSVLKTLNGWETYMNDYMNEFNGPPIHFLPNTYVETNRLNGPAIHKYKALLELNNTPFRDHNSITKASKRLWNYLIRQERVQDLFIRFIFGKPKSVRTVISDQESVNEMSDTNNPEPTRIVHKDHENISAFCINRTNPGFIAISTPKEIQEMDISMLLESTPFLEDEAEYDILNIQKASESLPSIDYLLVQHPADRLQSSPGGLAIHSSVLSTANPPGASNASNAAKNPIMHILLNTTFRAILVLNSVSIFLKGVDISFNRSNAIRLKAFADSVLIQRYPYICRDLKTDQ
ncbi:unnamed protein product [Oppiella nova]|uniref:RAVE complex protein Rav1 C-terminal domain-containing protein n=1 Tax=Oppiella nova TaxID=334625 RepID=A0A7R9M487_9ACAR|nr:unnamed protein product [Oppiella nova]CAG2169135.1 unnamed protein product [Oppiella nova]